MNIKITSESTCDLTPELVERYQLSLIPFGIVKSGQLYHDGVDIWAQDLIDHLAATGEICTSNAVNVGEYLELFRTYSSDYDAVIHITLGSGFSSSYQNACLAAQEFDNVYVVDSANLSTGQGHLVVAAAEKAREGAAPREIVAYLEDLRRRVEASFILYRLDFMQKGGRCSATTAFGANLLKIHPSIEVRDGQMVVGKKYRGRYDKCIRQYISDRVENRDDIIRERAFLTHSPFEPEYREIALSHAREVGGFRELYETEAGCTITCHCGNNCIGILFIREK